MTTARVLIGIAALGSVTALVKILLSELDDFTMEVALDQDAEGDEDIDDVEGVEALA